MASWSAAINLLNLVMVSARDVRLSFAVPLLAAVWKAVQPSRSFWNDFLELLLRLLFKCDLAPFLNSLGVDGPSALEINDICINHLLVRELVVEVGE